MIKSLDSNIKTKISNLETKKLNEAILNKIYQLLRKDKIWEELPLAEIHPLVQSRDVADFFS